MRHEHAGPFLFAVVFFVAVCLSRHAVPARSAVFTLPQPESNAVDLPSRAGTNRLIRLAVHFRPGGVEGNRRVESDAFDSRLDQLISTKECPKCDLRGAVLPGRDLRETDYPSLPEPRKNLITPAVWWGGRAPARGVRDRRRRR